MPSSRRLLGGLLPLALLLTACSDGDASPPSAGTSETPSASASPPTPQAPPTPEAPAATLSYVALGDSYVSAPLVPTTDTTTGCLRSDHNFPNLVVEALPDYALTDVSCSAATSTSMIGVQVTGETQQLPQFDALSEDTDLVTLGIGGNDFDVFSSLFVTCLQSAGQNPEGAPCQRAQGGGRTLLRQIAKIGGRVEAITTGIRDRAPQARVVVVNYPQLLPDTGTCPDLLPLATGDYPFVRRLNKALSAAVLDGGRAGGADVVDVYAASKGHDICADEPWVNGIETRADAALALHPFLAEQQAVADLVVALLPDGTTQS